MANGTFGGHTPAKYGFVFSKTHSASSLSCLSSCALRGDNERENHGSNALEAATYLTTIDSLGSSSSSSSSSSAASPPPSLKKSRIKSNFINVFAKKCKNPPETHRAGLNDTHRNGPDAATASPDNTGLRDPYRQDQPYRDERHSGTFFDTPASERAPATDRETAELSSPTRAGRPSSPPGRKPDAAAMPAPVVPGSATQPSANSNPNIFKKIISRKAHIPRMKAFKRLADDMQMESYPLDDEIQHELMITTAMKEEDEILNSKSNCASLLSKNKTTQFMLNYDNLKKFEIINKANESWNNNRRKSSSSLTNSESFRSSSRRGSFTNLLSGSTKRRNSVSSLTPTNTNNSSSTTVMHKTSKHQSKSKTSLLSLPFSPLKVSRKRKMGNYEDFSTDAEEYFSDDGGVSPWSPMVNTKRRLVGMSVTNSPKSPALDPYPSRRNSILMQSLQSTSDDFESMSLK